MTNREKLKFIESIIEYREQGIMKPGCPSDWFIIHYKKYKDLEPKILPKYVIFAPNEHQLDYWAPCILIDEDIEKNKAKYYSISVSSYIVEDLNLNNTWKNGDKENTFQKLSYKVVDEDFYISKMYNIAEHYYNYEISPYLKEKEEQQKIKQQKEIFIKNFLKL